MNKTILIGFLIITVVVLSCENKNKFKQSEHGFEYKFIKQGDGKAVEQNDFIAFNVDYYNDDKLLMSSHENSQGMPIILQMSARMVNDSTPINMAIKMLKERDSAVFKFNAKEFFTDSFGQPVPDSIQEESSIYAYTMMEDVIPADSFNTYIENIENKENKLQLDELDTYFKEQGLEPVTTESGLSYIILEEGEGEETPSVGDTVTVHYTGMLMNGQTFDSSVDKGKPIQFPLGVGYVIPGWDEGIALLHKHEKAKFFIPSKLGYGVKGAGRTIPPNSILIFEVELVDF